jgi:hypothetical protein
MKKLWNLLSPSQKAGGIVGYIAVLLTLLATAGATKNIYLLGWTLGIIFGSMAAVMLVGLYKDLKNSFTY